jgi:hypothetical protein
MNVSDNSQAAGLKSESQRDKLNRLFKAYGLLTEDVHKHNHYTIIRRTGIEKIAAAMGIRLSYEVCAAQADYAAVKATGKKPVGAKLIGVETFGSACAATSQNKYYLEMAEKRAKSRAVLQLADLYQEGVYGEDEADDFARSRNPEPWFEAPAAPVAQPAKPQAEAAKLASATLTPAVAPAESLVDDEPISKAQVLDLLRSAESHAQLNTFWKEEVKGFWELDVDVLAAAKETRARLNEALQNAA